MKYFNQWYSAGAGLHVNLKDVERRPLIFILAGWFAWAAFGSAARGGDRSPVIVAFGDSLTAGVAGQSYPEDLQTLLDQNGYRYRVENRGVSGDTTSDGLARLPEVIALHPALVLLEFGGNDGLRGVPVADIRANLDKMIREFKAAHIPVVLLGITLPPNYGPDYIKPFTDMYPELAHKYRLTFMPFLLADVYKNPALMYSNGVHPNGAGNKIVARDVFHLIQPLLKKTPAAKIK